jgi:hypothetical protein
MRVRHGGNNQKKEAGTIVDDGYPARPMVHMTVLSTVNNMHVSSCLPGLCLAYATESLA